jgi:hypothetical protein
MRPAVRPGRSFFLLALVLGVSSPGSAVTGLPGDPLATDGYDVRVFRGEALARVTEAYASPRLPRLTTAAAETRERVRAREAATARLRSASAGARVELSPLTGTVEVVTRGISPLTAADPGSDGATVVRRFLSAWPEIYGLDRGQIENLEVLGESRDGGVRTVSLRQTVHGRPVFQSDTRAVLDEEGRLLRLVGRLIPGVDEAAVPEVYELDAQEASRREAVYFPLAPGVVVPAWARVEITRGPADWYTVVDARTGILLWRKDIRYHLAAAVPDVCFSVYAQGDGKTPATSPAPHGEANAIPRTTVHMNAARSTAASPGGWLDGAKTTGPNVDAYLDRDGDDQPDDKGRPVTARARRKLRSDCPTFAFSYDPPPQADQDHGGNPLDQAYGFGAVTNLFYLVNWFHDRLYDLGFREGTFQEDDPIQAEAQYGSEAGIFNYASFTAPPDGSPGILRLSLWDGPETARDGSLDAQITVHELAHGVVSRMICDGAGLNWYPGRALAEGWSDFYALALLDGTAADGAFPVGSYASYRLGHHDFTDNYLFGLRRFPYSTDPATNPLTWKDVDDTRVDLKGQSPLEWELAGANEPHNAGELWALSLLEVRSQIIQQEGDVAGGNEITLQLVTKALAMTPCDPSFIDARDALLAADESLFGSEHKAAIWAGFAKRGLGVGAADSGGIAIHSGIRESFGVPTAASGNEVSAPASRKAVAAPATGTYTWPDAGKTPESECEKRGLPEPDTIPDGDLRGRCFSLAVPEHTPPDRITSIELHIDELSHPWIGDLVLFLEGPNGYGAEMIYRLAADFGGVPLLGANRGQCLGKTGSPVVLTSDTAVARKDFLVEGLTEDVADCFAGAWAPPLESPSWLTHAASPLSGFRDASSQGTWTLLVVDAVPDGDGQPGPPPRLKRWTLVVTSTADASP